MSRPILVWFRRDLRLNDNPALTWALKQSAPLLLVYVHSPQDEQPWPPGAASRWWLHHGLKALQSSLQAHGHHLQFFHGDAKAVISKLAAEHQVEAVVANELYEPHLYQRDLAVQQSLQAQQCPCHFFEHGLMYRPGSILNQQDKPYRVFTPFWRRVRSQLIEHPPMAIGMSDPATWPTTGIGQAMPVADLGLLDSHPWHRKLHEHWVPGEKNALLLLDDFVETGLADYDVQRDQPAVAGTSRLSPYLHFGEITPAQIIQRLMPLLDGAQANQQESIERFLSELGWREFAQHTLWHFPQSSEQSLNPKFGDGFWNADPDALKAWQQGKTGIALVDAGMKELWETGWMHNRVRMIVGSFLTKNLGIHWREGAQWFWDTLVDANLASNTMGWQWVAGSGVDAAPYYRIFNPETQAKRFDPQGIYLSRWLHQDDAPVEPIVDLADSRKAALARYQEWPIRK